MAAPPSVNVLTVSKDIKGFRRLEVHSKIEKLPI